MSDENTTNVNNGKPAEHFFIEVGDETLAKPNALCDLIEASGYKPTIIFCNMPSDTDLVKVILNKRGITSKKLIGNVMASNVSKTTQEALSGEVTALIVTDIGATHLDIKQFPILVNYSIHNDPEVYLHRTETAGSDSKIEQIISLVSPLDFTNFHYLKKLVSFEIKKMELPSKESLQGKKIERLIEQAVRSGFNEKTDLFPHIEFILKHADSKAALAMLLHNTLTVLPALQEKENNVRERSEGGDFQDGGRGGRDDRRGGRDDRRGGGGNGGRYGDRDSRRNGGGDSRTFEGGNGDRNGHGRGRGHHGAEDRRQPRNERRVSDVRFYLGKGSEHGFNEDKVRAAFVDSGSEELAKEIKRVIVRGNHSFIDFPEAKEAEVLNSMKDVKLGGDEKTLFLKAVKLPAANQGSNDGGQSDAFNDSTSATEDRPSAANEEL